jgi:hypothetical protein
MAEQLQAFLQTATASLLANTSGDRERGSGAEEGVALNAKTDTQVSQRKD